MGDTLRELFLVGGKLSLYCLENSESAHDPAFGATMKLRSPTRLQPRSAFTFVELVVVLLIMSILAAVAAPKFIRSLDYSRLESAARRLKIDLEQVRRAAQLKSRTETITFSGSTYSLSSGVQGLNHSTQA